MLEGLLSPPLLPRRVKLGRLLMGLSHRPKGYEAFVHVMETHYRILMKDIDSFERSFLLLYGKDWVISEHRVTQPRRRRVRSQFRVLVVKVERKGEWERWLGGRVKRDVGGGVGISG